MESLCRLSVLSTEKSLEMYNATRNATMSKKRAKEEEEDGKVDWNSVFPTSHIKAQVTNYEEVGRLSNKAAEYVGKRRQARRKHDY
jgi:hypothetical protein